MVSVVMFIIIGLTIFAFTHSGTVFYTKIGLGFLQSAAVANPTIIISGLFVLYVLLDRSVVNLVMFFIWLTVLTLTQYSVVSPLMKVLPEVEPVAKVATVNMLFNNEKVGSDLLTIASYDADVVMLQEFNRNNADEELLNIVEEKYPYSLYSVGAPENVDGEKSNYEYVDKEHKLGLAVFSKTPIVETHTNGRLYQAFTTTINNKTVQFINIHTVSPVTYSRHKAWLDSFEQVDALIENILVENPEQVIVLGGDFNANHNHTPFRNLLIKHGLYQNSNQTPTWAPKIGWVNLFKLDHILTTPQTHPTVVKKIRTEGSDHDGLMVKVYPTR